jgi:hypothetical protein
VRRDGNVQALHVYAGRQAGGCQHAVQDRW